MPVVALLSYIKKKNPHNAEQTSCYCSVLARLSHKILSSFVVTTASGGFLFFCPTDRLPGFGSGGEILAVQLHCQRHRQSSGTCA